MPFPAVTLRRWIGPGCRRGWSCTSGRGGPRARSYLLSCSHPRRPTRRHRSRSRSAACRRSPPCGRPARATRSSPCAARSSRLRATPEWPGSRCATATRCARSTGTCGWCASIAPAGASPLRSGHLAEGHPGRLARGATSVGARAEDRWRRPSGRERGRPLRGAITQARRPRPAVRRPIWLGPPEDSFGVLVPLHLVLVRTADLAVAIPGATAYGNGFGFDLAIRRAAANDDAFTLDRTLHWLERKDRRPGSAAHGSAIRRRPEGHQLGHLVGLLRPQNWTQTPPAGRCWCRMAAGVASASAASPTSPIGCGRCRLIGRLSSLSSGPRWACR
jgi:hypothetical protein